MAHPARADGRSNVASCWRDGPSPTLPCLDAKTPTTHNRCEVRVVGRVIVALATVASVAVAGVTACAGEPPTSQAKIACCQAMDQACARMGNGLSCCNAEQNAQMVGVNEELGFRRVESWPALN